MRTNYVKTLLNEGKPALGAWLSLPNVASARIMAQQRFDWLLVDMEHSAQHPGLMADMVATIADAGTCAPLVRIPANSVEWYKWALDAGAWGLVVPMVNTPAEAAAAVRWTRYPPEGSRSIGGVFAPYGFAAGGWSEYYAHANREILLIIQIESAVALQQVEEILAVPGIDAAFVGPNDLHAQIGLPPSSEGAEAEFLAALERIKAAARPHKLPLGMYCSDGVAAAARLREGFQMVSICNDAVLLAGGAATNLATAMAGEM